MKKWYRSKSVFLGISSIITAVVGLLQSGADWKTACLGGFGALSIVLRTITWEKINWK